MKTITFEGKQYEVPYWVKWVARDMDCKIYGYSERPIDFDHVRWDYTGKVFLIKEPLDWTKSLTEV